MKKYFLMFTPKILLVVMSTTVTVKADENAGHSHEEAMPMEQASHEHATMGHTMEPMHDLTGTTFSHETARLPQAVPTETVILEDGDSYDITAAYVKKAVGNRTLRMLAYNGSIPGPLIKINQGSEVTIRFINNSDVEQTIHSHGVRVDNRYDGVPGLTQDAVSPGEIFTYRLKFRDAGMFWYHPHTREDYGQELGLYGNYLVEPSAKDYWNPVNREVPLVIDDILIDGDHIADFYREFTNFALLGRFGNEFLVNGQTDFKLSAKRGEVIRFFLTNTSNTRVYNLSLPEIQIKIVGADLGKYEHEMFTQSFLISPAERVVMEAGFDRPGTYELIHTQPEGKTVLARITVSDTETVTTSYSDSFLNLRHNSDVESEFRGFRRYLDREPDKNLLLTIDLDGQEIDHSEHAHMQPEEEMHDHSEHVASGNTGRGQYQPLTPTAEVLESVQWSDPQQTDRTHITPDINWKVVDQHSGKVNSGIDDWNFMAGDLVKIRLTNDDDADHIMQHPIHFHGQQFVVLSVDKIPNNNLAWKDTTLVFPGQTMDLLVRMSNPGKWMAHCHISEHLHAGMALTFRVENTDGSAPGDDYRATSSGIHH